MTTEKDAQTEKLSPDTKGHKIPKDDTPGIGEALGESGLEAEQIDPLDVALDIRIKLIGADVREGDFGEYVIIYYDSGDGSTLGLSCGGKVVVRKIKQLKDCSMFPVYATPKKIKKYYDLQ